VAVRVVDCPGCRDVGEALRVVDVANSGALSSTVPCRGFPPDGEPLAVKLASSSFRLPLASQPMLVMVKLPYSFWPRPSPSTLTSPAA
jgi:hypothetical protein